MKAYLLYMKKGVNSGVFFADGGESWNHAPIQLLIDFSVYLTAATTIGNIEFNLIKSMEEVLHNRQRCVLLHVVLLKIIREKHTSEAYLIIQTSHMELFKK